MLADLRIRDTYVNLVKMVKNLHCLGSVLFKFLELLDTVWVFVN